MRDWISDAGVKPIQKQHFKLNQPHKTGTRFGMLTVS